MRDHFFDELTYPFHARARAFWTAWRWAVLYKAPLAYRALLRDAMRDAAKQAVLEAHRVARREARRAA